MQTASNKRTRGSIEVFAFMFFQRSEQDINKRLRKYAKMIFAIWPWRSQVIHDMLCTPTSSTTPNQPVGAAAVADCHGTMIKWGWIPAVLRTSLPIITAYAVASAIRYSQVTLYRHTKPCRNGLATTITNVRTTWHYTVAMVSSGISGSRSALRLDQRIIAAA